MKNYYHNRPEIRCCGNCRYLQYREYCYEVVDDETTYVELTAVCNKWRLKDGVKKKLERWANIYINDIGMICTAHYRSEEDALKESVGSKYVAVAVPFTIEYEEKGIDE